MKPVRILLLLVVAWLSAAAGLTARADAGALEIKAAGSGGAVRPIGPHRVSFRAEPGLEATAARLAPGAERALALIEADLEGLPRVEHVEVRLVKHAERLSTVAPPGRSAPPWAAGVAWPDTGIVAVAARTPDGNLIDMESTLAHELAHMAIERALGTGRVPRWLHEGFAYQHSSEFTMERAQTLAMAAFRGAIVPIQALDSSFPARHDGVSLAYAQSYDFVGFLTERGRWPDADDNGDRWPFRHFLAEIAAGKSVDGAAQVAFGRTIVELETEWYESVRSRYMWYPIAALGGTFWVFLALLAVIGWRRRTRQKRARLAEMATEEAAFEAAARLDPERALLADQGELLH